jgi:ankyrin repeat protein
MKVRLLLATSLLIGVPFSGLAAGAEPDVTVAEAAMRRDIPAVRSLIDRKVDVNATGPDGTTALEWMIRIDDIETSKMLLNAGADPRKANRLGVTPIALAAANGNTELIRLLLDKGVDPNTIDPNGEPVTWAAIRSGNVEAVRLFLDRGATVDFKDSVKQSSLMLAVREDEPDIVRLLISRGAEVNAVTRVGATPAFVLPNSVPGFGHGIGIIRGGLPDRGSRYLIPGGMTPLMYAARDGRIESARLLIQNGANLEATDPNGITPLLMAISNNQMETARFFVERGAQINVVDWYGRSPLWSAVEVRNMDIDNATFVNGVDREPVLEFIKLLLDKGANPNVRTAETPPIRRFILPITGSLEWVDFVGMTPFLYAARAGDLTVMKLLLEHGADPKIPTFAGTTALMAAAGMNWTFAQTYDEGTDHLLEAVKMCLDLGMSIHDMNSMGLTALHAAANRPGSDPIIKFLVEKGAKLDVKDNEGRTPLNWAEGVFLATHPGVPKPSAIELIKGYMAKQNLKTND